MFFFLFVKQKPTECAGTRLNSAVHKLRPHITLPHGRRTYRGICHQTVAWVICCDTECNIIRIRAAPIMETLSCGCAKSHVEAYFVWGVGGDDNDISEPLMRATAGTIPCKYPTCTSVIIELTWADKDVRRSRQSLLPLINHESAVLHACFWKGKHPPSTTTTHSVNSSYEDNFCGIVRTIIPAWYCD